MTRHSPWIIIALIFAGYLFHSRPQDIQVLQYKGTLLFFTAVLAYLIRRYLVQIRIVPIDIKQITLPQAIMLGAMAITQAVIFLGAAKVMTGL